MGVADGETQLTTWCQEYAQAPWCGKPGLRLESILVSAQVQRYLQAGYLAVEGLISAEELSSARAAIDKAVALRTADDQRSMAEKKGTQSPESSRITMVRNILNPACSKTGPGRSLCFVLILASLLLTGCSRLFPKEAGPHLGHFKQEAPAVGTPAPNVVLSDIDGNPVELSSLLGDKPVVVQLGSYTCPVFRYRRFDMQPLRARYKDQVEFVVLYTTEAHPVGSNSPYVDREWVPWHNRLTRVKTRESLSLDERREQAQFSIKQMHSNARFLIDSMNNTGWQAYGRAPSAAFLINTEGNVRFRQVWIEPKRLEEEIKLLLVQTTSSQ